MSRGKFASIGRCFLAWDSSGTWNLLTIWKLLQRFWVCVQEDTWEGKNGAPPTHWLLRNPLGAWIVDSNCAEQLNFCSAGQSGCQPEGCHHRWTWFSPAWVSAASVYSGCPCGTTVAPILTLTMYFVIYWSPGSLLILLLVNQLACCLPLCQSLLPNPPQLPLAEAENFEVRSLAVAGFSVDFLCVNPLLSC